MKLLQLLPKFCPPPGNNVIREQVEKAALRINSPQEMKQNFTKASRLWNDFFPLLLTESKLRWMDGLKITGSRCVVFANDGIQTGTLQRGKKIYF